MARRYGKPRRRASKESKRRAPAEPQRPDSVQDRLLGLDIIIAAGEQTQKNLDQDIKANYGVLSALVDAKLEDCLGREIGSGSDMERYKDAFVVVALEAAINDPRLFRHFAIMYARGPDGTFAKHSELVEPLSRPDFDWVAFEWRQVLAKYPLTPKVQLFNLLAIMSNSLEFRIRPFLFALAYLIDITTEARVRGGPSTESRDDVNQRFRDHFFRKEKEYWGANVVEIPTTKSIRDGASKVLKGALERAEAAGTFDAKRVASLHEFRKSLLNDNVSPEQQTVGKDYRYGIADLRNQLQHANVSFDKDRIHLGHAAMHWDYLSGEPLRKLPSILFANMEKEIGRLEGLMCLIRSWETTLNNLDSWLTQWKVGEPVPFPPKPP